MGWFVGWGPDCGKGVNKRSSAGRHIQWYDHTMRSVMFKNNPASLPQLFSG